MQNTSYKKFPAFSIFWAMFCGECVFGDIAKTSRDGERKEEQLT